MIRRILHLSDVHVGADGRDGFGSPALESLNRLLDAVDEVPDIDLMVVSGDIADDGSREGTSAVRDRIAAFARPRAIAQVYCMGNHDDRDSFGAELGTGHIAADGTQTGERWEGGVEVAAVSVHQGLRVITLDSMVPGLVHGELSDEQTAWLSRVLSTPAPHGSIVVLHHPPFAPAGSIFFQSAALARTQGLRSALLGTDVRAVLCGHFHAPSFTVLSGVPISIAPAVVWRIDSTAPPTVVRGVTGAGASVIDLVEDSPRFQLVSADDPDAGRVLFEVDAVTLEPRSEPAPR